MKILLFRCLFLGVAIACTLSARLYADQTEDEATIRKSAASYVEAFNQHDAKAIAALWSPEAVFTNPMTGGEVTGRAAIEAQLVAIFQESKEIKIEVTVNSVQFVSPNVAIEEGIARVLHPGEAPDVTIYSAVHIRRDGKWLIDRMSEESAPGIRSHYGRMKDLEWMIGSWVDDDGEAKLETTCKWTKNQNFIVRSFMVSVEDTIDLSGIQIIGWDPEANKIRSWVFDSDGGFGRATWVKKNDSWIINAAATLPDGRKSSAIKTMTLVDGDTITWKSTGRSLDGEILPNIGPITIKRNTDSE